MSKLLEIKVNDFQSVWEVVLEPGRFTILVGRSNSGKSAIFRALTTLARNSSSVKSLVRAGSTRLDVGAAFEDGAVKVARGEGLSTYWIARGGESTELVKAGTSVPEEVEAFLRLPVAGNGEDIVFSTQFDKPFLLDTPASQVARAVGALSNVNLLLEASREATRRSRAARSEGTTLGEEAERTRTEAAEEAGRAADLESLRERAAGHVEAARDQVTRAERLAATAEEIRVAAAALTNLREREWPEFDAEAIGQAEAAAGRAANLAGAASAVRAAAEGVRSAMTARERAEIAESAARDDLSGYLATLETCEACGQVLGSGTRGEHVHGVAKTEEVEA